MQIIENADYLTLAQSCQNGAYFSKI